MMQTNFRYATLIAVVFGFTFTFTFMFIRPVDAQEPMIVLSPSHSYSTPTTSDNAFAQDHDYSTKHKVKPNEPLSRIIAAYYAGSDINRRFLTLAIVQKNPHAFVRANPNFLYAGRTLHLPSLNEIQAMILNKKTTSSENYSGSNNSQSQIYFHGF